jgi:Tfp pilus assembly protein FimV
MQPATGVPSFSLYRGSLLALLIGTALAVWLLVQPTSSEENGGALRPAVVTPTVAAAPGQPTATTGTPAATTTPVAGSTQPAGATVTRPAGTTTPSGTAPAGTTTPSAGGGSYTVVSGDTLSGICSVQRPSMANTDCVSSLRSLNALSGDTLSVGQTLRLP